MEEFIFIDFFRKCRAREEKIEEKQRGNLETGSPLVVVGLLPAYLAVFAWGTCRI